MCRSIPLVSFSTTHSRSPYGRRAWVAGAFGGEGPSAARRDVGMARLIRDTPVIIPRAVNRDQAPRGDRGGGLIGEHRREQRLAKAGQRNAEFLEGPRPSFGRPPADRYLANSRRKAAIVTLPVLRMFLDHHEDILRFRNLRQRRFDDRLWRAPRQGTVATLKLHP